ncbi:MAG: hypothetical protein Q9160_000756 [Pyrenula sp. 1 TL-2023]
MQSATSAYISTGGNRHPSAADWDHQSNILAFGAGQNIAIARPLDIAHNGVQATLSAHKDKVNAVKFLPSNDRVERTLLCGGADCSLSVWLLNSTTLKAKLLRFLKAHDGAINAISVSKFNGVFATASADATVKIWCYDLQNDDCSKLLHAITLAPRYIPLALVLGEFKEEQSYDSLFLVVGGTRNVIQVYAFSDLRTKASAKLQASLSGHDGWIRSLALTRAEQQEHDDLLLASASQDKYVRLWRLSKGNLSRLSTMGPSEQIGAPVESSLTSKVQTVEASGVKYSVTFEALLLGHEDWVYGAAWSPGQGHLQLLTASADSSLTIWEPDPDSGIWINHIHLGEISGQKGSTSATGSTGGFWNGLWSSDGGTVFTLGKTGSWRIWQYDREQSYWVQFVGLSGHVESVTDICWERQGQYLLSTSSDQTTRLHGRWERGATSSWHELSRPQIHGYDLNCVACVRADQFVSGADEKPLRVFNEPRAIANILKSLSRISLSPHDIDALPNTASIPVLGLSNKAVANVEEDGPLDADAPADDLKEEATVSAISSTLDHPKPPLEDDLARKTLWPEHEKLYGHGYEISSVTASNDHSVIATACKSSSIDHAVIRLFDCNDWHEIKPALSSHSLTVTRLQFSPDDQMLLSVGRDRQWAVFERVEQGGTAYKLRASNPRGHSRMILDAAWVPSTQLRMFLTAGRDKSVKFWVSEGESFVCKATISRDLPVTAVAVNVDASDTFSLAIGEENGQLSLHAGTLSPLMVKDSTIVAAEHCPSRSVTRLAWRPRTRDGQAELAVASQDTSVRILIF